MTRLLLLRHGRTAWTAQGRYQGQTDVALDDSGRCQVRRLAARLRSENVDAIYSSDLRRAWETAKIVAAEHHLPVRPEPRLRELHFGEWEGMTHREIGETETLALRRWRDDPMDTSPPGGESLDSMVRRVRAAYLELIEHHPNDTVVVVGHGGALRVLLCTALALPRSSWRRFRFDVASLSEVRTYNQGAILTLFNDTSHLANRVLSVDGTEGSDSEAERRAAQEEQPCAEAGGARGRS